MKDMYTKDIALVLYTDKVPEIYKAELAEEGIPLIIGRPLRVRVRRALQSVRRW